MKSELSHNENWLLDMGDNLLDWICAIAITFWLLALGVLKKQRRTNR